MLPRFWRWLGFHIHSWSKWDVTHEIVRNSTKGIRGFRQERSCIDCGKRQSDLIY